MTSFPFSLQNENEQNINIVLKDANGDQRDDSRFKKTFRELGVVAHAFNPSTWEAEAGRFLSSRPAWSTE